MEKMKVRVIIRTRNDIPLLNTRSTHQTHVHPCQWILYRPLGTNVSTAAISVTIWAARFLGIGVLGP